MSSDIYTVERIAPDTYRLDEHGIANCYLAAGGERALLIDTGLGVGDLRAEVKKLTDLPVEVALTHAHCDHAGGLGWFEQYYVGEADRAPVNRLLSSRFAASLMKPKDVSFPKYPFRPSAVPIQDGHVFDLGGRKIRAMNVPGHTRGSLALIDEKESLVFTGDDINESLWMQLPGCTTLRDWIPGGKRLLELAKSYQPWCGHGAGKQSIAQLEQTYAMVELLAGRRNAVFGKTCYYPEKGKIPQIVYKTSRLN